MTAKKEVMTLTAVGEEIAALDRGLNPFHVTLGITVVGTVNVSVLYAINKLTSAIVSWIAHADLTAKTVDCVGTLISPVYGVKLVYNSGTGSASLHIDQAGTG